MVKALRLVMIIFGAIGIIVGLSDIFIPDQLAKMYGFSAVADWVRWSSALGGASFIAAGVWVIVAARDPIKHILWVKFVITKSLLFAVVTAYSLIQGYVNFSQVGGMFILFVVFAVLFFIFYPWRPKPSSA
jgi:hypothetical protein